MKKIFSVFVFIFAFTAVFQNPSAMAMGKRHKKAYPEVRVIAKDELARKMNAGEDIQIVNVLNPDYYKLGVIKGSKKIPLKELGTRMGELDKTKLVVTYCASYQCGASREAAHLLEQNGFNVAAYEGGAKEWKEAGLPLEA